MKVVYRKTVRFSDHPYYFSDHPYHTRKEYPQKMHGLVLEPDKELSKKELKHVEAVLRKEIKKLQYCAHITTIYNFKAETN
jgi:hypothetical protein